MTYGLGLFLAEGIVIATDSRTNAGVDHIAVMRKLNVFHKPGSHLLALASAGNLATTQSVVSLLNQRLGLAGHPGNLFEAPTMFDATRIVGDTLREVMSREAPHVQAYGDPNASLLLGGEITIVFVMINQHFVILAGEGYHTQINRIVDVAVKCCQHGHVGSQIAIGRGEHGQHLRREFG